LLFEIGIGRIDKDRKYRQVFIRHVCLTDRIRSTYRLAQIDAEMIPKEFRKNWARLIQKIYQVDPLLCPKCQDPMKIIGFIENNEIIEKILWHLGLWETRSHDPPKSSDKKPANLEIELTYDITYSQLPRIDYWTQ
jgi:hypothetical protein